MRKNKENKLDWVYMVANVELEKKNQMMLI